MPSYRSKNEGIQRLTIDASLSTQLRLLIRNPDERDYI